MRRSRLKLGLAIAFLLPALAQGKEPATKAARPSSRPLEAPPATQVRESRFLDRLTFLVLPEYMTVANKLTGKTLSGLGIGLGALYAFSEKWGLALNVRQSFSMSDGFSNLFTAFDLRATYAITGDLMGQKRDVTMEGSSVYEESQVAASGLRAQFCVNEYLFNSSVAAVPFPGFGIALYYEFAASGAGRPGYVIGGRYDRVSNGTVTIEPKAFFAGLSFRF